MLRFHRRSVVPVITDSVLEYFHADNGKHIVEYLKYIDVTYV